MRLSWAKNLLLILVVTSSKLVAAAPPVIWFGNDAKFLNSGTIIVPGLGTGFVKSTAGTFSVGGIAPSDVTGGTANRFAYFDGTGALASLNNWVKNTFGGAEVNQAPILTDLGAPGSFVLNNRSIVVDTTNDLINATLYNYLDQINLGGVNDYQGVTGHEFFVQQTGVNDITADLVVDFPRLQLGVGGVGSTSQNDYVHLANVRSSGNHTSSRLNAYTGQVSMDGGTTTNEANSFSGSTYIGGTAQYAYGLNQTVQSAGDVQQAMYGVFVNMLTDSGANTQNAYGLVSQMSGDVANDYVGVNSSINGIVGGQSSGLVINNQGSVAGNSNLINLTNSATAPNANGISLFNSGAVSNDFNSVSLTNNANIGNNSNGVIISENNTITKNASGFAYYHTGNIGDGSGVGATFLNSNISSGTIDGGLNALAFAASVDVTGYFGGVGLYTNGATLGQGGQGFSWNNSADFTNTNTSLIGFHLNNSAPGYTLNGVQIFNNQDMTEETRGFFYNNQGDSRTGTGLDISMSGNATDDVRGVRVDMTAQTSSSTTNHVLSGEFSGGNFNVQGSFTPFSGANVDIGNNITSTATVNTALTGTDTIIQLLQANLIVHDDISTGPFGIDTNMLGIVSQIGVDSGKTVPLMRSSLIGTSVPIGSGGFITEHHVIGILGLPSFGGAVTNATRMGLIDEIIFGQNFCDGATDCWFIKNQDDNSENHLARLAINTASKKVSGTNRLDVLGNTLLTGLLELVGHFKSTGTSPTATPDANAGTGATCSVSGATDLAGTVQLVTGSGAWAAGAQCAITFNAAYAVAPKCVLTPVNASAAVATVNLYGTKTTTDLILNFVNADVAATTYEWDYHCVETQ